MTSSLFEPALLLPTLLAAMAYTLTPGPAFLALLGIGATQGRRAGIGFLAGHLAGDVVWASLALVASESARIGLCADAGTGRRLVSGQYASGFLCQLLGWLLADVAGDLCRMSGSERSF